MSYPWLIVIANWSRLKLKFEIFYATTPYLLDFIQTVDKNVTKNVYVTFNSFCKKI